MFKAINDWFQSKRRTRESFQRLRTIEDPFVRDLTVELEVKLAENPKDDRILLALKMLRDIGFLCNNDPRNFAFGNKAYPTNFNFHLSALFPAQTMVKMDHWNPSQDYCPAFISAFHDYIIVYKHYMFEICHRSGIIGRKNFPEVPVWRTPQYYDFDSQTFRCCVGGVTPEGTYLNHHGGLFIYRHDSTTFIPFDMSINSGSMIHLTCDRIKACRFGSAFDFDYQLAYQFSEGRERDVLIANGVLYILNHKGVPPVTDRKATKPEDYGFEPRAYIDPNSIFSYKLSKPREHIDTFCPSSERHFITTVGSEEESVNFCERAANHVD